MSKQKLSKEKSLQRTKMYAQLIACVAVLGAGAYMVKNVFDDSKTVSQSPYYEDTELPEITTEQATTEPDPNKLLFESSNIATKDKYKGDLILVNEEHQYFGGDEDLVSITDMNYENEISCFTAVDSTYTILRHVYGPMAEMIQDFYDKYNNDTLIIYGSYRTTEFQQQLYEDDLAQSDDGESTRVAKPGFSEHETGLAFDFTESVNHDYNGTGDFAWINANCFKYGFIVRYTEAKQRLTKIQDEPWHFRYVGIPHAYYMDSKDLCLEEYIDLVREHPYDGEHLEFSDNDGNDYEVYFVASDDGSEKTTVPVPTGTRYEISGNNVDGFIVTVYKGQKPVVEEAPTKSFEDSETSDEDTDSEETGDSADESSDGEDY